ncbi:esterase/lipase [Ilyonectria destructans]|nr:esterase/lipase [Ilyonectria destructans]
MSLQLDPEFAAGAAPIIAAMTAFKKPAAHDVISRRKAMDASDFGFGKPALPEGLEHEIHHIPTPDGYQLPVWRYKKKQTDSKLGAAVIHIHGGGLIGFSPEISFAPLCHHAMETGVQFFSVDYRLAPEHPYPTPVEDCWTALTWVLSQASVFGVDKSRIAVMGESAGGGLAAGLALLARDRGLNPPLARQLLLYPMLDDRTKAKLPPGVFGLWDDVDNLTGWTAYLGSKAGGDDVPVYAAANRVEDVTGLPPLYMDIGQLDIFVQENHAYVGKFLAAGIEAEFHVYPGLSHGWEGLMPSHFASAAVTQNRDRQLKKL